MSRKREGRRATYVKAAAHRIIEELAGVGSGGRNNALNVAAFAMGQLVQPGGLDERDAELELTRAGAELGLSANEVKQTVKSGLSKGMNKPRELPCDDDDEEAVRLEVKAVAHRPLQPIQAPPEHLRGVLQATWDVLCGWTIEDASDGLKAFMRQRRLRWRDITTSGCRELLPSERRWFVEQLDMLAVLGEPDVAQRLGWVGEYGLWLGWQEPGLLVPIWSPVWRWAPVGYRWRPWNEQRRAKRKTWAMNGSEPWRSLPLIRRGPWDAIHDDWDKVRERISAYNTQLRAEGRPTIPEPPRREDHGPKDEHIIVVVEGEPDFLTLQNELSALGVTCIGLPGAMWLEAWDVLLRDAHCVVVATDADESGEAAYVKIGLACDRLNVRRKRITADGAKDWSDVVSFQKGTAAEVAAYLREVSR